ncbi:acr-16 [Symbiodinium natans]|uniref:Acr-16 protein n=1 Tax=Symbiodinium natans TaxID=878477 RepID=A0A812SXK8_9DINO|nr:acr-16 [Symbiodinium natans]
MEIRMFKVQGVDSSRGQMRLKVWVRLAWSDLRLSWDPALYGNITQVHFRTQPPTKDTEIWAPDVQVYNANEGNAATLDESLATVTSDGSVFWSRPGILDTLCKFSGLVAFPFDHLSCAMEWGGWSWSGGFQGIMLRGEGYSESTSEDTAGSSYQEYSIDAVSVQTKTNFYDAYPSEPWTLVKYTVQLGRASFYYSLLIILPTTLLTYLSFGVFFMSHEVGERLSFGITLVLVIEVMKTTAASFVPVCGELLWIDLFMLVSTVFCCASLLETMTILFLAFHVEQHVLPSWLAWAAPWFLCRSDSNNNILVESQAGRIYRQLNRENSDRLQASTAKLQKGAKMEELSQWKFSETDTERLIFFENLFYLLDSDSNGLITTEEAATMLSFVNLSLSRTTLEETLDDAWEPKRLFDCGDFLEICVELMWTTPFKEIKLGAENYISSQNRHAKRCHTYWLKWSRTVDKWSRFWLPLLYTVALGILMNLELTDNYGAGEGGTKMFEGFGPISMSTPGILQALITPVVGLISIITWVQMRRAAHQWKAQQKAAMKIRDTVPDDASRSKPRWTVRSTVRSTPTIESDSEMEESDEMQTANFHDDMV